jgi:hypothetical protein
LNAFLLFLLELKLATNTTFSICVHYKTQSLLLHNIPNRLPILSLLVNVIYKNNRCLFWESQGSHKHIPYTKCRVTDLWSPRYIQLALGLKGFIQSSQSKKQRFTAIEVTDKITALYALIFSVRKVHRLINHGQEVNPAHWYHRAVTVSWTIWLCRWHNNSLFWFCSFSSVWDVFIWRDWALHNC